MAQNAGGSLSLSTIYGKQLDRHFTPDESRL
jgi:hypothetical protein